MAYLTLDGDPAAEVDAAAPNTNDELVRTLVVRRRTEAGRDVDDNLRYAWSDLLQAIALVREDRAEYDAEGALVQWTGQAVLANAADVPITESMSVHEPLTGRRFKITKVVDQPQSTVLRLELITSG